MGMQNSSVFGQLSEVSALEHAEQIKARRESEKKRQESKKMAAFENKQKLKQQQQPIDALDIDEQIELLQIVARQALIRDSEQEFDAAAETIQNFARLAML